MQKSTKERVKYLEGKLDKNSNSILFARLADDYLQMDRVDDAIEMCEKGIKQHPYYVTGHYILGKCYLRKKLFDQAEKELKRVLLFDPKYIAAHRDYGELMAQIGWTNTCEMSYEEILRIDPFNEKAKLRLDELQEQLALTREEKPEEREEMEFDEVEESILTEIAPSIDEHATEPSREVTMADIEEEHVEQEPYELEYEQQVAEDYTDEDEQFEKENDLESPSVSKELFLETDDVFEDDKANLDLLEDIFRDDTPPDLSLSEEFDSKIEDELMSNFEEEKPGTAEPRHLFDEDTTSEPIDETEQEEFEGFDDEDLFALLSEDHPQVESASKPKRVEPPIEPQSKKEPIPKLEYRDISDVESSQKRKEKIVTPTLGEIYAAQQQYAKAIGVYEILRSKDPDNQLYKQKIEYLQKKLEESQSE